MAQPPAIDVPIRACFLPFRSPRWYQRRLVQFDLQEAREADCSNAQKLLELEHPAPWHSHGSFLKCFAYYRCRACEWSCAVPRLWFLSLGVEELGGWSL